VIDIAVNADKGAFMKFVLGDFFKLSTKAAGSFEAVFDRGALVAIEPSLHERYADTLHSVLEGGARILLVTVEHDPFKNGKLGPPFSVSHDTVRRLFPPPQFDVELLAREDRMPVEAVWKQRGCSHFYEAVYLITLRKKKT
jgi:thiopurine S-methyltransferase